MRAPLRNSGSLRSLGPVTSVGRWSAPLLRPTLRDRGRRLLAGGPTLFGTRYGHEREVRPAERYHPTSSGFPDLRRRSRGSRSGDGSSLA